jgi:hypothetical protein
MTNTQPESKTGHYNELSAGESIRLFAVPDRPGGALKGPVE